jgi:hypothetical protein
MLHQKEQNKKEKETRGEKWRGTAYCMECRAKGKERV